MKEYVALINSTVQNAPFSLCTVGITRPDPNYHIVNNNRVTTEFDFVISGKGTVICNNEKYNVKAGDVYHLPYGCSFISDSDKNDPLIKIWVSAYGELMPNILRAFRLNEKVHFQNADLCYPIFKEILKVCRDESLTISDKEDKTAILLHSLLNRLYKITLRGENDSSAGKNDAYIIKSYLDNHIHDTVKIKDLSALIFKSESQTIRIFENAFGTTPYSYLLQLRLSAAKQLLTQTNMSVKAIAFNLGFSDEHYFSYIFKEKIGKTPTNYRKSPLLEFK